MDTTGRCLLFKDNPWPVHTPPDGGCSEGEAGFRAEEVNGGLELALTGVSVHVGGPSWHGCDGEVTSWQLHTPRSRVEQVLVTWAFYMWSLTEGQCVLFFWALPVKNHSALALFFPTGHRLSPSLLKLNQKTHLRQLPQGQMEHFNALSLESWSDTKSLDVDFVS